MEKERPVYELLEACFFNVNKAKRTARQIRGGFVASESAVSVPQVTSAVPQIETAEVESTDDWERKSSTQTLENKDYEFASTSPKKSVPKQQKNVEDILKDFANKVARWRANGRNNPGPAQFAHFLNEHFLCNQLDPLPKTKMVTVARKAVVMEIEKISRMEPSQQPKAGKGIIKPQRLSKDAGARPELTAQKPAQSLLSSTSAAVTAIGSSNFESLVARLESQQNQLQSIREKLNDQ